MTTPIAPYSEAGATSDDARYLSHIPAELRHLAVPIGDIRLDPNNVNKHPAEQLEVIKSMLAEFGQRQLLVARRSTGILEAGEGRVLAGKAIGWTHMAVLYFDDDPITALRYALGDNRSARLSEVDESMLREQILLLHEEGSDLASIGWAEDDVTAILEGEAPPEPEDLEEPDAGEPPVEPFIQVGDLVELGPHRLVCGDSTDPSVVEQLMQGGAADMVFTDPPYGVAYEGSPALAREALANDNLGLEGTQAFVHRSVAAWPLRAGGAWYWCGSRTETSVWEIDKPQRSADHPTTKPVEVPARAIRNSSVRGGIVFDGFGGSGTTLIAAHQLGRRARIIELSPGYCDVIVRRAKALGIPAVLRRAGAELEWEDRG